ncbi:hypothetical protein NPX13_g9590 [Xylaria arbuscula]|uniref:Uncharacterized protein n=1 Tax=Xylaria arbuscula TaxID=114810 RepID=A0A9W8TIA5_9PEZI|nr:hypothetical protein NPX13_g9590 [Xylaria arbuscula]
MGSFEFDGRTGEGREGRRGLCPRNATQRNVTLTYLEHGIVRVHRHPIYEVVEDEDLLAVAGLEARLDALAFPPLRGVCESYAGSRGRAGDRQLAQLGRYRAYPCATTIRLFPAASRAAKPVSPSIGPSAAPVFPQHRLAPSAAIEASRAMVTSVVEASPSSAELLVNAGCCQKLPDDVARCCANELVLSTSHGHHIRPFL